MIVVHIRCAFNRFLCVGIIVESRYAWIWFVEVCLLVWIETLT
ncbi:hypothetical protein HanPSC8_Chr00c086g0804301 [Helianthus annuus]|nr:hypothetical protein HanPSC8_Chr00c086g0804301 [Helianthus annuus]